MVKVKKSNKKVHGIKKFIFLVSILLAYGLFVVFKFGIQDGLSVTLLTWAFFVTCTPIADAGFLVDFPVRVIFGFKMIFSELVVWVLATIIIVASLGLNPTIFETTKLLEIFHTVLINPWPLWSIIIASAIGTFLSIYIGDEIYNLVQMHNHHKRIRKLQYRRLILEILLFIFVLLLYFALLQLTNVAIPK
ncbi:hypothetical protein KBC51_00925 [Candidatus Saccharibacteria bacterium]|jgi:hypothetical protein|nr:hypothetical protein [Candidatus Saccharibacteria bacterium]